MFTHKDHQGSTTSVTTASGSIVEQFIYDPWGNKQAVVQASSLGSYLLGTTSYRGYTGHEDIDHLDLIHMNGRVYDPIIGRFLQADPHIQAPNNAQNYNRYSYVLNNPMSYTDPSGYFFKKLKKLVKKFWKPLVAIAVTYFTAGAASGWVSTWGASWGTAATVTSAATLTTAGAIATGALAGAAGGFVGGALMTGSLKGALRGAFTGAIAGAAGGYANFGDVAGFGDAAGRVGVAALGGCAAGKASGGSCRKGASTAAMVQALTMGAAELYEKVSTKVSENTGKPYNEKGEPHLWQEGRPDVGKQLDEATLDRIARGEIKPPLSSDQCGFMQGAAKGPYMDAFAEFHDGLHDYSFIPDDQVSLILTMPPSYVVTVLAAAQPFSHNYYLDFLQEKRL